MRRSEGAGAHGRSMAKVGPVVEALRTSAGRGAEAGEGWGLVEMESGGSVFYRMSLCLPASRRHQGPGLYSLRGRG